LSTKIHLEKDVYTTAIERINFILDEFERIYLSFSGGKDSSVLLQLFLQEAERKNKLPVNVLYIDFEAQYKATINHVEELLINNPKVEPFWICLPMNLRNAVSSYQSQWQCWNPEKKIRWVRELPTYDCVINNLDYFPFFTYGVEFEEFIVKFSEWFAQGEKTACLVAIRADESLNRFRTIKNLKKERYNDLGYSTKISEKVYNFYPIYDWRVEDIWSSVGKFDLKYNKIYDLMYQQGKSIHRMRLCQPYGDDQRQGLELFRYLEPETWFKVVDRVSGANFGNLYANTYLMGRMRVVLPEDHSWKSYTFFLLSTLPKYESEWYKIKFQVFFDWWGKHGYPIDQEEQGLRFSSMMFDKEERKREAKKEIPSWRRLAEVIIKNDKICKRLSFAGTKGQFNKYKELKEIYGY